MADKPWSVAFAGTGDTSKENAAALLDDWLPQKLDHVTLPTRIGRSHTGLKRAEEWLVKEVGEDSLESAAVPELVDVLKGHQNDGAEAYLVFVPAEEWDEDSDEAKLVRRCIELGIPVKDLTAGLDDFVPPEPPAEPGQDEPQQDAPRRRGKPRGDADAGPERPAQSTTTPVEDIIAGVEESVDRAVSRADGSAPQAGDVAVVRGGTLVAEPGAVTVNLSPATIQALLALAGALAQDIKASVQAELPGQRAPKTYPFWVDADGNYRPREGRGRGKAGEEKADLTVAEIQKLGLEFPA